MTANDFRVVAKELGTKIAWTDEELLQSIQVHECLVAYFRGRGEGMISFALQLELSTLKSYANARKWKSSDGTWQIRRKDGTFV